MFINVVARDLHKLFQDGGFTTGTLNGEFDRVVIVTIDIVVMFVV